MDPESKKLLQETLALAEENNKMLRKVRSVQKWAVFWQSLKLAIIIGVAFGVFYYVEPYLDKVLDLYNSISRAEQKANGTGSVSDLLKKLGN